MNKKEIIIIGGGGHCKACIDVIELEGKYSIAGIIDIPEKVGQNVLGYPIIASDKDLKEMVNKYDYFLITIGQIKSPSLRIGLFQQLKQYGKTLPVIVSPKAYVSEHAEVKEGTIVMHDVIVNVDSRVGNNCIINNKALIEHEVVIGNHCHISTASVLNGEVKVGNRCTIGSNSTVINGVAIADNVIVGASSLINQPIKEEGIYVGSPAKKIKNG